MGGCSCRFLGTVCLRRDELGNCDGPALAFVLSMDQSDRTLASIGETTIPDKVGVSSLALTP